MGITLDGGSPAQGRGRRDLAVTIAVANGRVSGLASGPPDRPQALDCFHFGCRCKNIAGDES